jgi:hypothetical protein
MATIMRPRPWLLGLALTACYSGGESQDVVGGPGSDGGSSGVGGEVTTGGSTSGTGVDATTGDDPTGAPPPTTLDPTTGGDVTSTAGDESTSAATTGGPPGDCPRVRVLVAPGDVLNVRPAPSTADEPVGTLGSGAIVDVLGIVDGEAIEGDATWYHVQAGDLVGYVWGGRVECTADEPPTDGFFLPLECGAQATISQGNFGEFSHQGQSAYAFDFSLALGTPLVAIADGTVSHLHAGTMPGDPCYDGGGQECSDAANYVGLLHGDGTRSMYAHLSAVSVALGQVVPRGAQVGLVGSTGWSTGPHAHVARSEHCGGGWCQSIAVVFADVPGDGVPDTGEVVVSGNCP